MTHTTHTEEHTANHRLRLLGLFGALALLLSALALPTFAHATEAPATDHEPGEIIVVYKRSAGPFVTFSAPTKLGMLGKGVRVPFDVEKIDTIDTAFAGEGSCAVMKLENDFQASAAIAALNADPKVAYAQRNFRYRLNDTIPTQAQSQEQSQDQPQERPLQTTAFSTQQGSTPQGFSPLATSNDPRLRLQYYLNPWGDSNGFGANVINAWDYAKADGNVTIAVLDTGVRTTHQDIYDNILHDLAWDAFNESEPGVITDYVGHGTFVCGIASAVTNNSIGIAGASYNAKLLPIKVFNDETDSASGGDRVIAETSWILRAYVYMENLIKNNAVPNLRVVNMSLGGYDPLEEVDYALEEMINTFRDEYNVLTVCAAGNGDGVEPLTIPNYPSDYEACFSVTALTEKGENTEWSDYNSAKDISAPGENIYSTYNRGNTAYTTNFGTSFSAPLVSGIAALLWAAVPDLSVDDAVVAMTSTAHKLNPKGENYHPTSGSAGAIDGEAAVRFALEHFADPTRTSIHNAQIETVDWLYYDGSAKKPAATVTLDGNQLVEGQDFELVYSQNEEVGKAIVRAVGKGDYRGTATTSFHICYDLLDSRYFFPRSISDKEYTGEELTPVPTITYNGRRLVKDVDFTITYESNIYGPVATATIEGIGNYRGTHTTTFKIVAPLDYDDLESAQTTAQNLLSGTQQIPAGQAGPAGSRWVRPEAAEALQKALDDAQAAHDNVLLTQEDVDAATKRLEEAIQAFEDALYPKDISKAVVTGVQNKTYTGKAISQTPVVKLGDEILNPLGDYSVSFANNVQAGTATLTVTGTGIYRGTVTKTFKIEKLPIKTVAINPASATNQNYTGKALKPKVVVKDNQGNTVPASAYTIAYTNNTNPGTATITVKAKPAASYAGSAKATFKIVAKDMPVYWLYNTKTGENLYTASTNELKGLTKKPQWKNKGIVWYAPEKGSPVYRLVNKKTNDHHWTMSKTEANTLVKRGKWKMDFGGKPAFYSGGSKDVWRLRHDKRIAQQQAGTHRFATSQAQIKSLTKSGWVRESERLKATRYK